MLRISAPAKINLHLHVTGQRDDGYHTLDSLAVFADCGDTLELEDAADFSFTAHGAFAHSFSAAELSTGTDSKNLMVKAARLMAASAGRPLHLRLSLIKDLPFGSGLGGGSADAAACLRGLSRLWNVPLPDRNDILKLGRDVPVCLASQACVMRDTGETLRPAPRLPALPAVLVWPGAPVSTPSVFRALSLPDWSGPVSFSRPFDTPREIADTLKLLSVNDLQPPSLFLTPVIGEAISTLARQPGCHLARMSGSGSACFGLFSTLAEAGRAADEISAANPTWWVRATSLNSGREV